MRSKSRPPPKDDIEQSTSTNSNSNSNSSGHQHNHSEGSHQLQQAKKVRRMKQAAAMLAILVAAIIVAIALLGNMDNDDENAANNNASPPPPPSLAPTIGKNDNDEPSVFIPTNIGNNNNNNSPTLAPPLLPTLTISAPSITVPSPNPTVAPSPNPTTLQPTTTPTTLKPTTTPTTTPTTASPSLEPSVSDNSNIFDNFDETVSPTDNFQVLQVQNHDSTAFTQGLYYNQDTGMLTEGTGIYGRSLVRIWDPLTGQVLRETSTLDSAFFGEGVAWYLDQDGQERFIQLTWKAQRAFIYDTDLNLLQSFSYNQRTTTNQGWGITFDPVEKVFYVSDGSRFIHVWDLNFELVRKFPVTWKDALTGTNAVPDLNELEWDPISKTILANVWYKNYIVRIWPGSSTVGKVIQAYDMSTLQSGGGNVLNGIAHYSANKWWITGKEWRNLYLIEFNE
mmetsp:Transcript_39539/g.95605  ORF Transcript_39539/g.95605 Transcript_39539/m.95605 type:complete len:450 (-) Transcript_39539:2-1351(-)